MNEGGYLMLKCTESCSSEEYEPLSFPQIQKMFERRL